MANRSSGPDIEFSHLRGEFGLTEYGTLSLLKT